MRNLLLALIPAGLILSGSAVTLLAVAPTHAAGTTISYVVATSPTP